LIKWRYTKKGDGFVYSLLIVIFTFIILITAAFLFQTKFSEVSKTKHLGEKQFELFDIYQVGENALFFIDEASRMSLYQTIYDLSRTGGYFQLTGEDVDVITASSACGSYAGYALWNNETADCFPYDLTDQFNDAVNENLNKYFNYYLIAEIPSYNYKIGFSSKDHYTVFSGKARSKLSFSSRVIDGIAISEGMMQSMTGDCPELNLVEIKDIECTQSTEAKCLLLPEVYEILKQAKQIAASKNVELVVTSAYRSYESQRKLWEESGKDSSRVAKPSCYAPHTTGRAVDVVIKGGSGMNSASISVMSIGDRQLLEDIMVKAGFVRYYKEFWHYEYGTTRWQEAKKLGKHVA